MDTTKSSTCEPYNPPLLITLDDKLSEEEKKIVKSILEEKLLKMYEIWGRVKIPRCYSGEPCEYFSSDDLNLRYYTEEWNCRRWRYNKDGIDVQSLIADIRKHYHIYRPHMHVLITGDIARDFDCKEILRGLAFPTVTSSLPGLPKNAVFEAPGVAAISVGSIKILDGDDWPTAFLIEAAYQFGILHGLPDADSPNYGGPFYCSHEYCVMGGRHDKESIDKILKNNPNLYCEYDLRRLIDNLELVYRGHHFC
jgi:hypothetical protein